MAPTIVGQILKRGIFPSVLGLVLIPAGVALAENGSVAPVQNPTQVFVTPDYRGDFSDRSVVTGDWAGKRQELANKGVAFDFNLIQAAQGVVSGGIEDGWEYAGRGETVLNLDTSKMGLWPGGLLTVMGEGNFGNDIGNKTGALFATNMNNILPEPDSDFVLPQVTFTQFFSPQVGIVLGKFATIGDKGGDMNEFAHGKGDKQFLNLAFNINPIGALTVPYSTLGANLVYLPSDKLTIVGLVLDPHGKPDSAGFDELFENGATFGLEGRYKTDFLEKTGHQLLGWTHSTSDYTDFDQSAANLIIPGLPISEADHSWSAYWNMDQYLFQPDPSVDRGIGFFLRYGLSDGDANPIKNFASAGFGGKGMIAGRENDRFGIGYFYAGVADNQVTNELRFKDGQGFEAFYNFALTPAIQITPDIQWLDPGQSKVDDSWLLGVRIFTAL